MRTLPAEDLFTFTIEILNPLMHNVPKWSKWSDFLSTTKKCKNKILVNFYFDTRDSKGYVLNTLRRAMKLTYILKHVKRNSAKTLNSKYSNFMIINANYV